MKIDFNQPIRDLEGNPIEETEEIQVVTHINGKPEVTRQVKKVFDKDGAVKLVTLKAVCATALTAVFKDEQNLPAEKKVLRFTLAQKIVATKEAIELNPEEVVMIKKLVGKMSGPLVVGQVYNILK